MNLVLKLGITVGLLVVMGTIIPLEVFAAFIDCNGSVNVCNGTEAGDTMRLSNPVLGVGKGTYFITGHGGSDLIQVTWGLENRDLSVRGDAGNDNIRIQNNAGKSISSLSGDQGNDVITIVASDNVGAFGGPGADSIRAIAGTKNPNVFLFQNGGDNQPDGNKDILDCSGIPLSTAKVNVADGDVAKNCDTVIAS